MRAVRRSLLATVVLGWCGCTTPAPGPTVATPPAPKPAPPPLDTRPLRGPCTPLAFADTTSVPEASAAAWLTIDGAPALVVTSDSGNRGAYGIIDPETGVTRETGTWPLGDAGDDVEGLATRDGKLYGLTSAGWMRVWERRPDHTFALVAGPYPLGPVDLPPRASTLGTLPPEGAGMVCDSHKSNCGRNYEGLCLAAHPPNPSCIGFALAKADGHLYCLALDGDRLVARHDAAIAVGIPGAMADCAFDDADHLYVGANLFGLSHVYRVDGWQATETAHLVDLGVLGSGFPEVVAVRGDVVYRMSDTGGSPSEMAKFRCSRDER